MADVKQCDNCGNVQEDRDEWEFWWYTIGTPNGGESEACCRECAIALVKKAHKRKLKIDREIAAEEAV